MLDPDDDVTCLQKLVDLHDLDRGIIVCHPRPTATWPVLVADLLTALGKHPRALTRERCTASGPELLQVWLRAERTQHLIVLRADRIADELRGRLVALAAAAGTALWLVWHHHDQPPLPYPVLAWGTAVDALRALGGNVAHSPVAEDVIYSDPYAAARFAARQWRPDGHRLGPRVPYTQHAWSGCDVGALLQRMTIDAVTASDLRTRLRAARGGFAAEGRSLTVPDLDPAELAILGPRLAPDTIARVRLLACPVTAAALVLALATDSDAVQLGPLRADRDPDHATHEVGLIAGRYRIPHRARPFLRAALHSHVQPGPGQPLFAPPGRNWVSARRLAHMIRRGAELSDIAAPKGARPLYGHRPTSPFAAEITCRARVTDP